MTPKEKPILMSGPMVRAILDGRKTQTRRVGKIQSDKYTELGTSSIGHATKGHVILATYRAYPGRGTARHAICECPFGNIGDRLWVRETFAHIPDLTYRADDHGQGHDDLPPGICWRPSIFMRRKDSRITLEIVSVRVERVQDINEADAKAEGAEFIYPPGVGPGGHRYGFRDLWNSINAKRGFGLEKNPWVWVITFRKL